MAQGRTVTWCLARALGSHGAVQDPSISRCLRKRKTSRKWEETWGPASVPWPCCQSLPAPRMNVAFVPSAASKGFQATTSSQGAPPKLLVLETAMTKLPEVLTLSEKRSARH